MTNRLGHPEHDGGSDVISPAIDARPSRPARSTSLPQVAHTPRGLRHFPLASAFTSRFETWCTLASAANCYWIAKQGFDDEDTGSAWKSGKFLLPFHEIWAWVVFAGGRFSAQKHSWEYRLGASTATLGFGSFFRLGELVHFFPCPANEGRHLMTFFSPPRDHFFRPLTHDNRELCAAVLRALHELVHGANADYAEVLTRELVLEIVQRMLSKPELRALAFDGKEPVRAEEERAYAGELLRKLKDHGWLEDYRDPIDLRPTLKLSRAGKAFSETFANLDDSRAKTRQRNMRSARKSLGAFIATRDVDELLDAHEFASRVVQDLQDDIEYFRHLIQSLTREALEQKVAWGEFNDFIEKRFAREYSVRLVADSAERHRGQITEALEAVRALEGDQRSVVDAHLLQRAPWLEQTTQSRSPMLWLADRIESTVEAACSLKLPMLRSEMSNYVRRFTSLLRQALSLDYGSESALGRTMAWLKERPEPARALLLDLMSRRLGTTEIRLPGGVLRWSVRDREVSSQELGPLIVDEASRLNALLRRAEAEAFAFSDQKVLKGLLPHLQEGPITLASLPIGTAEEAVRILHAVGAARSAEGRQLLRARKLPGKVSTPYFQADDYEIRVASDSASSNEEA